MWKLRVFIDPTNVHAMSPVRNRTPPSALLKTLSSICLGTRAPDPSLNADHLTYEARGPIHAIIRATPEETHIPKPISRERVIAHHPGIDDLPRRNKIRAPFHPSTITRKPSQPRINPRFTPSSDRSSLITPHVKTVLPRAKLSQYASPPEGLSFWQSCTRNEEASAPVPYKIDASTRVIQDGHTDEVFRDVPFIISTRLLKVILNAFMCHKCHHDPDKHTQCAHT